MASSPGASCISDPNFAVICAFLERFAKSCGITYPTFKELQEMLENVEEVPQELVDLHIKLLRKARKTVFLEKWEKALIKFCHTYSNQDGWELERFGYKKTRLEVKLRVLKMLLEGQFDLNSKFKASVNTLESEELRSKPLGKDKFGRVYWLQFDPSFNIRVYREDLDEESWTLVAQDRESLVILLQQLCENEYPLDLNLLNEDSFDLQKETLDTGQNNISMENVNHIEQNENSNKILKVNDSYKDEESIQHIPEKEKLSVNDNLTKLSNVENFDVNQIQNENSSKTHNTVVEKNNSENILINSEINGDKTVNIEKPCETDDLGEEIEEPVMYITGEGSGEECMTGNPEKEDKSNKEPEKLAAESIEMQGVEDTSQCSSENIPSPKINLEKIKPTPKLWSIDTICGVNSKKESNEKKNIENLEISDIKLKQKNFSSFSIDSVLEKNNEKKDLIGLSETKPFPQFVVGSSSDALAELKKLDNSANKSNSVKDNLTECNSNSSVISYEKTQLLPCVMISKTEKLTDISQNREIILSKMDSFNVPVTDLKLKSVEHNINLKTLENSELKSNENKQNREKKNYNENEQKTKETNVIENETKPSKVNETFSEEKVEHTEKVPEVENKDVGNIDLRVSKILEKHVVKENELSNNDVLINKKSNIIMLEENCEGEQKRKKEDFSNTKIITQKPLELSLEVGKKPELSNVEVKEIEKYYKTEEKPISVSTENLGSQKLNIIEYAVNESYNVENRLKNFDHVHSEYSESQQVSKSESSKGRVIVENNLSKNFGDEVILPNKAIFEEKKEKIDSKCKKEENDENILSQCQSQDHEIIVKSQLVIPSVKKEISNIVTNEEKLQDLSNSQSCSKEEENNEKTELFAEKNQEFELREQLQTNKDTLLNVNKCENEKKLEENTEKSILKEKNIVNISLKSYENIFEKLEKEPEASVKEKCLEDNVKLDEIIEGKIKGSEGLEEEQKSSSDFNLKKKGENKKLESSSEIKTEKIKTNLKLNEDIVLSKELKVPEHLKEKQYDATCFKDKPESSESFQIAKDFSGVEKKEKDDLKLIENTDNELDEKLKEKLMEDDLKSNKKDVTKEPVQKALPSNAKVEGKLEIDSKLIECVDETSTIKTEESDFEKNTILLCESNVNIREIGINDSIKIEEETLTKDDSKLNNVISEVQNVCTEEYNVSKISPDELSLNKHIKEVSVAEAESGKKLNIEKDLELDKSKEEIQAKSSDESNKTAEKERICDDSVKSADVEESKEILLKSSRKRKKGSLPARIMSRNRKTATEETREEETDTTFDKSKSETDLEFEDEKIETSDELHGETVKENIEQKENLGEDLEDHSRKTDEQKSEIQKSDVTLIRRGRKPRGRKRRKIIIGADESKNNTGEIAKDKAKSGEDEKEAGTVKKKGRPKKDDDSNRVGGRQVTSREIKLLGITNPEYELTSIRQSRRIAQIKLREEAERRRLEALQLESFKNKKKTTKSSKKKSRKNADSDSYDEKDEANENDSDNDKSKQTKEKKTRKRKKKDKMVFDELNPWLSSSGSSSADEEEEEIEEEPHDDEELVFKSDHEFSPESDVEDPDYKPIKRARTAKVEESKEEAGKYDDTSCEKCAKNDHPEWILLCDKCDKGWHASCVRPAIMVVPEGDWFCPPCEHTSLIMKLQESLKQYDRCQKQREIEELRKKRLAFVGISLDNVLPLSKKSSKSQDDDNEKKSNSETESGSEAESSESESGSDDSSEPVYQLRERRSNVTSYRYNEYDEMIKSALQDEIEAVKGAGNAGRGKDINNIVNAEKQKQETEELEKENESTVPKIIEEENDEKIITDAKPKDKIKKDNDDYEMETEGDVIEEEEEDIDEIPPVVPKHYSKKKKSKSLKITSLDFTSEEEDRNSDSDFKGASSEEESDYSLPSDSESSDNRKSRKNGPLRRSTRARTSRYDRDFINDESDDSPKRKPTKREWDSSESSDSDRSWGRKKRKGNRSSYKSVVRQSRKSSKKKKNKRKSFDSDNEESLTISRPRNKKIKYGGLDSIDEQPVLSKRTRGKKINYQEMNGSDSEDEVKKQNSRPSRVIESDDDFIAENEKDEDGQEDESEEIESGVDEDEEEESGNEEFSGQKEVKRKHEKLKKKRIISDSEDTEKNDETTQQDLLSEVNENAENVNKEGEENLENLKSCNASNQNKVFAESEKFTQATEEKKISDTEKETAENNLKHLPSNAAHPDYPGGSGIFAKIGKIKITPSRAELASQLVGMAPVDSTIDDGKSTFTQNVEDKASCENTFKSEQFANQSSAIKSIDSINTSTNFLLRTLQNNQKPNVDDSSIPSNNSPNNSLIQATRPPLPFPPNCPSGTPLNMAALLSSQSQGATGLDDIKPIVTSLPNTNNRSQFSSFQGIISPPPTMNMLTAKIPTTVTGISEIESQNQSKKKGSKSKKKLETSLPSPENGSDVPAAKDNVWPQRVEEFNKMQGVQDSLPKKKGRGRGKKQLLAEAQAQALARTQDKQEQFLPQTLPSEGGSVISRILNTSQSPSSFQRSDLNQFSAAPRIRPPFGPNLPPNFSSPPRPMPAMRPRPPTVGNTIFHTSHPLDPSPSGGSAINISIANSGLTKSSPSITSPFTRGVTLPVVPSRFPPDPNVRPLFTPGNSPPRPEFSPFSHYYGNFPPPGSSLPSSENSNFSSSTFSESFGEDTQGSGNTANPKQFEDDTGGEFGGLASYFASQREDDLET